MRFAAIRVSYIRQGQRQFASLRAQWSVPLVFTERCPDNPPVTTVGPGDPAQPGGPALQQSPECAVYTACGPGPPLPVVPTAMSPCR